MIRSKAYIIHGVRMQVGLNLQCLFIFLISLCFQAYPFSNNVRGQLQDVIQFNQQNIANYTERYDINQRAIQELDRKATASEHSIAANEKEIKTVEGKRDAAWSSDYKKQADGEIRKLEAVRRNLQAEKKRFEDEREALKGKNEDLMANIVNARQANVGLENQMADLNKETVSAPRKNVVLNRPDTGNNQAPGPIPLKKAETSAPIMEAKEKDLAPGPIGEKAMAETQEGSLTPSEASERTSLGQNGSDASPSLENEIVEGESNKPAPAPEHPTTTESDSKIDPSSVPNKEALATPAENPPNSPASPPKHKSVQGDGGGGGGAGGMGRGEGGGLGSGFLLGAVVGGGVGALVGALVGHDSKSNKNHPPQVLDLQNWSEGLQIPNAPPAHLSASEFKRLKEIVKAEKTDSELRGIALKQMNGFPLNLHERKILYR